MRHRPAPVVLMQCTTDVSTDLGDIQCGEARTVGRIAFVLSIAFSSALFSFLFVATAVTILLEPSEEAQSWGLLWALSLPSFLLLSVPSVLAYPRYRNLSTASARIGLYALLVVAVGGLGLGGTLLLTAMPF
jgi:hypothetical protein